MMNYPTLMEAPQCTDPSHFAAGDVNNNEPEEPTQETDYFMKMQEVHNALMENLNGCDAEWSLLVSAAMSYRYKTTLVIYPPWIEDDEHEIDIDEMINILSETPPLRTYFDLMESDDFFEADHNILFLMHWLFCSQRKHLSPVEGSDMSLLLRNLVYPRWLRKPDYIFEIVTAGPPTSEEELFTLQSAHYPLFWTFYGDKVDTFFGLLHEGFNSNKNEDWTLRLCVDPETALKDSSFSPAWGGSLLSPCLSCLAVAECLQNPSSIQFSEPNASVEIRDKTAVRVRYLFFYGQDLETFSPPGKWDHLCNFIKKHKKQLRFIGCIIAVSTFCFLKRDIRNGWVGYFQNQTRSFFAILKNQIAKRTSMLR